MLRSSSSFCHWSGIARENHCGVADQLGDRLGARAAEQRCETADLDVVELAHGAVVVGDLGGDQPADHVVLRVVPPFLTSP